MTAFFFKEYVISFLPQNFILNFLAFNYFLTWILSEIGPFVNEAIPEKSTGLITQPFTVEVSLSSRFFHPKFEFPAVSSRSIRNKAKRKKETDRRLFFSDLVTELV